MGGLNAEFLRRDEVEALGFRAVGKNTLIHRTAVLVGCERIELGDSVRIDPFTLISASETVAIGSYVHVSAYASIMGAGGVTIEDYCNLSFGTRIFSTSDDFSGTGMTGPMVPIDYRNVISAPVRIGRHSILGSGTIVMPGTIIGEGVATGALTFVNAPLEPWSVYVGAPARRTGARKRDILELEARFLSARRQA